MAVSSLPQSINSGLSLDGPSLVEHAGLTYEPLSAGTHLERVWADAPKGWKGHQIEFPEVSTQSHICHWNCVQDEIEHTVKCF